MKKMSESTFIVIINILLTIAMSGIVGWALFFGMGFGREYYHTSTPEQLYGVCGWFTISKYLICLAMLAVVIFLLLMGIRSYIVEIPDELWEES